MGPAVALDSAPMKQLVSARIVFDAQQTQSPREVLAGMDQERKRKRIKALEDDIKYLEEEIKDHREELRDSTAASAFSGRPKPAQP